MSRMVRKAASCRVPPRLLDALLLAQEVVRQEVYGLLSQTREHVESVLQRIERPEPRLPVVKATAMQPQPRKRRRSSPVHCSTDFSAHLALPRTPTQELLGSSLQGELRQHQLAGVRWLATLHDNNLSGILSDELQQDRQVQVVGLFAYLQSQGNGGPFLICASAHTLQAWAAELHRLLPQGILVHMYSSDTAGSHSLLDLLFRGGQGEGNPLTRVVLISHEAFAAEQHVICRHPFQYVVLDWSCQAAAAQNLELVHGMPGRPRILLLTAAHPAQRPHQPLAELWALLRMVLPDSWEHVCAAVNKLAAEVQQEQMPAQQAGQLLDGIVAMLQDIIDRFVLSRTSDDVDLGQQRRDTKVNLYDLFADGG